MPEIEPAVLDLRYTVTGSGDFYVDLAKGLSQINRRLYRQGRQYFVAGVSVKCTTNLDPNAVYKQVAIATAPNSWVVHESYTKLFNLWNEQHKTNAAAIGIKRGKWADFKVYLEDAHRTGTELALIDGDYDTTTAVDAPEEWNHSEIFYSLDDGTTGVPTVFSPTFHILGADNGTTSMGMINHYQNSRTHVNQNGPAVDDDADTTIFALVRGTLDDDATDDIINEIERDNDSPPYDHDEFPGSGTNAPHPHIVAWGSTPGGSASLKGFTAPCGLVQIQADGAMEVIFHLMPGTYRGVMAPRMGQ